MIVLLVVLGLVLVIGGLGAVFFVRANATSPAAANDPSPGAGGGGSIGDRAGKALRAPQTIVDEELAVSPSGAQMRAFSLPSARPIQVQVHGRTHADKGFMVYVMEESQWANFKAGTFQHVPEFEGLKVRSFEHTGTLPAGSWALVVQNSENILNTMVVQVHVVSDPK